MVLLLRHQRREPFSSLNACQQGNSEEARRVKSVGAADQSRAGTDSFRPGATAMPYKHFMNVDLVTDAEFCAIFSSG